jgi:hypothetical protein
VKIQEPSKWIEAGNVSSEYCCNMAAGFCSALMASPPQQFNEESSVKARNKFREKALTLLNGSLKDLTNFSTIGPKTALLIYNYR